mgnify:CR=1 FL=1
MTGLLYLIVIVMWAVVLVPIWLKGHDRTQTEKNLLEEAKFRRSGVGDNANLCHLDNLHL